MNIKVGDIVKYKYNGFLCGRVRKIWFVKSSMLKDTHLVEFDSGHGYRQYKQPKYLKVIRRKS